MINLKHLAFAFSLTISFAHEAHAVVLNAARDGICTAEHYEVADGRFTDEQIGWLRKILDFVHTPERLPSLSYELTSNNPVSYDEFRTLLRSKPFKQWSGKALENACRGLMQAKLKVKETAEQIKTNKAGAEIADPYPKYKVAHERLFTVLHDQFGVQTIRDESCDE